MKKLVNWAWLFAIVAAGMGGLDLLAPSYFTSVISWSIFGITLQMLAGVSILGLAVMGLTKIPFSDML